MEGNKSLINQLKFGNSQTISDAVRLLGHKPQPFVWLTVIFTLIFSIVFLWNSCTQFLKLSCHASPSWKSMKMIATNQCTTSTYYIITFVIEHANAIFLVKYLFNTSSFYNYTNLLHDVRLHSPLYQLYSFLELIFSNVIWAYSSFKQNHIISFSQPPTGSAESDKLRKLCTRSPFASEA